MRVAISLFREEKLSVITPEIVLYIMYTPHSVRGKTRSCDKLFTQNASGRSVRFPVLQKHEPSLVVDLLREFSSRWVLGTKSLAADQRELGRTLAVLQNVNRR